MRGIALLSRKKLLLMTKELEGKTDEQIAQAVQSFADQLKKGLNNLPNTGGLN
jgi:hypothetical protein